MKKLFKYIMITACLGLAVWSGGCKKATDKSFLDPTDIGRINEQTVFADSALSIQFLNSVYAELDKTYFMENGTGGGGLWAFSDASDDGEARYSGGFSQGFNLANVAGASDSAPSLATWNVCYAMVRRVNVFLYNIERAPLSAAKKKQLIAESRFLRAYAYYHLLRVFGGVPLLGDKKYELSDDFMLPRNSFVETLGYIEKELNEVALILPLEQLPEDFGRPTKGAALAVKAKVLLMAASPLYNENNPNSGPLKSILGYESYDVNRWKIAADAAKSVMDLGLYRLVEDNTTAPGYGYYDMGIQRKNSEYIFQIMRNTGRFYEQYMLPGSRGGQNFGNPTQQLIDDYPMKNGKLISESGSGYVETTPYLNRDPRFYYTIIYNQALWLDRTSLTKKPVDLYALAPGDGMGSATYNTVSGYLWRRFCNENAGGNYGVSSQIGLVISRYADILLAFAEATNEFQGPNAAVYQAVEAVRKRAGLDPYALAPGLTKEEMRTVIRHERRIEFASEEGHRLFDIFRWKIAENLLNGPMGGMKWTKNGNTFTNARITFETRKFNSPQMYYRAIPLKEINKNNLLIQNPGW
ncbi:RagB/SusD family nutrient uptake outer membrane protein [Pedobacter caeni]|uniref:Starch-binding associating with outer membrane n=1 Tax=Pedobacter caeni TaxID=288992 RepID=A0A1M5HK07_9SPHI|nr:RagB/SusD family nutrient uptake outer membrane protein [Pedobacter caeni]SHG16280.1 Starch-binding associating with outer membrane [Pedobacter caeni]